MIRIRFALPTDAAVSGHEKSVFSALVDGHHALPEIAAHCGLSEVEVIDALASLGKRMLVVFRAGRPYFRAGDRFVDSNGTPVDGNVS